MQFILTGFIPDKGFRVFTFQGIGAGQVRTGFTVRADLALIQKYGIRVQELPLLCRGLLERRMETDPDRALTFTEAEMSIHANSLAADRDAAQKKKSVRRPPPRQVGAGRQVPSVTVNHKVR